jgi:hypothetical protein
LYRSAYLDQLFAEPENQTAGLKGLPLDKGFRAFYEKRRVLVSPGVSFARVVNELMESFKATEIAALNIEAQPEWIGLNPFKPILEKIAKAHGYELQRGWWRKPIDHVVERRCRIDGGRSWSTLTPLEVEIGATGASVSYDLSLIHRVSPGFSWYKLYNSRESAVLGVMAQVDYLDTMGELISAVSPQSMPMTVPTCCSMCRTCANSMRVGFSSPPGMRHYGALEVAITDGP